MVERLRDRVQGRVDAWSDASPTPAAGDLVAGLAEPCRWP
jgi:hypothetical protein